MVGQEGGVGLGDSEDMIVGGVGENGGFER